nr:9325_t:CDS:2 [Entrophospora candida]CAG8584677.1 11608_t:CDS:2 [Entrophospora candida]
MEILEILYEHIWKGKFSAPIQDRLTSSNMCVLDIGSGTGSWITSMAESYPKSSFIGLDLIDFKKGDDQPNLAFIKGNIFDGLPFPDNTFDYVHQSNMMTSIQKDQWKFVIDEIVRVTKPNGWMEFMERNPRANSLGPVMDELSKLFVAYLRSSGVHTKINKELEKMLLNTNQVTDIGINSKGIPIGSWGGYIGELFCKTFDELYSARLSGLLDFMRIPEEVLIEKKVKIAPLEYNKYKTYAKVYRTYGRKI